LSSFTLLVGPYVVALCIQIRSGETSAMNTVKISILYPNQDGAQFDFDHYTKKHMPRSIALLSAHPGYRGVSVERGIGGTEPNSPPAYIAMCHFSFTSVEAFMEAFLPNAEELQGDMANYTNIEPVIQFNQVLVTNGAN
jgi:uncharacterized protein (TIGR02118 family)